MSKAKSLDIRSAILLVESFLKRYHTILFFLLVSIGIISALLIIVSIINLSNSTGSKANNMINGNFDETTIRRVQSLGNNSQSSPGNRVSPFVEP